MRTLSSAKSHSRVVVKINPISEPQARFILNTIEMWQCNYVVNNLKYALMKKNLINLLDMFSDITQRGSDVDNIITIYIKYLK